MKKGEEEMNQTLNKPQHQTDRQKRIQASFDKLVKRNGKALERLSKK